MGDFQSLFGLAGWLAEGKGEEGGRGGAGIGRGGVGNNAVLSALSHAPKDILGIDKDLNVSCGRYSSRRGEKDWKGGTTSLVGGGSFGC